MRRSPWQGYCVQFGLILDEAGLLTDMNIPHSTRSMVASFLNEATWVNGFTNDWHMQEETRKTNNQRCAARKWASLFGNVRCDRESAQQKGGGRHDTSGGTHNLNMIGNMPVAQMQDLLCQFEGAIAQYGVRDGLVLDQCANAIAQHCHLQPKRPTRHAILAAYLAITGRKNGRTEVAHAAAYGASQSNFTRWRSFILSELRGEPLGFELRETATWHAAQVRDAGSDRTEQAHAYDSVSKEAQPGGASRAHLTPSERTAQDLLDLQRVPEPKLARQHSQQSTLIGCAEHRHVVDVPMICPGGDESITRRNHELPQSISNDTCPLGAEVVLGRHMHAGGTSDTRSSDILRELQDGRHASLPSPFGDGNV